MSDSGPRATQRSPRLLDLFCGAGGAAIGYHRAGFEVVGVDIKPQPRYPFRFVQADALDVLRSITDYPTLSGEMWRPGYFDAIHASPPCQAFSTATKRNGTQGKHPDLIEPTRLALIATGLAWVIENVPSAPLISPVRVCGTALGLSVDGYRLQRHREFELGFTPAGPWPDCACPFDRRPVMDVTGGGPTHAPRLDGGGGRPYKGTADQVRRIMGMPWATKAECNEAIPPAYTELVGSFLIHGRAFKDGEHPYYDSRKLAAA